MERSIVSRPCTPRRRKWFGRQDRSEVQILRSLQLPLRKHQRLAQSFLTKLGTIYGGCGNPQSECSHRCGCLQWCDCTHARRRPNTISPSLYLSGHRRPRTMSLRLSHCGMHGLHRSETTKRSNGHTTRRMKKRKLVVARDIRKSSSHYAHRKCYLIV